MADRSRTIPTVFNLQRKRIGLPVQTKRLAPALVDDLLDVLHIITGKIALHKEPIEVGAAVSRAVEEVQPAIRCSGA